MIKVFLWFLILLGSMVNCARSLYFCTASDSNYFRPLMNLIGGIHKHHFDELGEIAVFNLGFTEEQRRELNLIAKLKVYEVEKKHPDILKRFKTTVWGKTVPGWYAWKPVVIKQALDMFPYVLFIDAGTTLMKPINALFEHMWAKGYFFHSGSSWPMKKQTCNYQAESFDLFSEDKKWILEAPGLESGLMGLTHDIYDSFVLPTYELAVDLKNFTDDGTAQGGWGACRHDQTVFSAQVLSLGLNIHHHFLNPEEEFLLEQAGNQCVPFNIACVPWVVSEKTYIYCSRNDIRNYDHYVSFIRYE